MFRTFVGFVMISTAVVLPATADMAGRNLLLTPQVAIPIGSLRELAGGGAGVGSMRN